MGGNANTTTQPATTLSTAGENSEVGPLSILPICVSLFAVVAIAIAACVFYRKRQRQRAQLLARQIRVTERRIDAVGSLREKRGKDVKQKPLYCPPTDVRASASEPSIVQRPIPGIRPHYVIRAYQPQLKKLQTQTSVINASACTCDYGAESTVCSACRDRADEKLSKRDASTGSLAVELATVPSVGSLTTINTPSGNSVIRRTVSDTAGAPIETAETLKTGNTVEKDEATPSKQILAWMEKSSGQYPTTTNLPSTLPPSSLDTQLPSSFPGVEGYMSTTITTTNEQEPPPNTPISHSAVTSVEGNEKAMGYVSEDEKWV